MVTANRLRLSERGPESLESVARVALDSRAGRRLTDVEWIGARAKLLEFMSMLRTWYQKSKKEGVQSW